MNGDFDDAAEAGKYASLRADLEADGSLEPEVQGSITQPEEAYDAGQHGVPQPPQHQHQEHQGEDQEQYDLMSDPLNHFDQRMQRLEEHTSASTARTGFVDAVTRAEETARRELGEDYDSACHHLESGRIAELEKMLPDSSRQAQVLAHQYGLPNAAALRGAILDRDRIAIADHAMRTGRDPASAYYELAIERGYAPSRVFSKTQRRGLTSAIMGADGEDFDKLWKIYANGSRMEDEFAKRRR